MNLDFFDPNFFKKYNIQYVNEYLSDVDKQNIINEKYKGVLYNKKEFYNEETNETIITYNISSNRKNYDEFKNLLNTLFNYQSTIRDYPISCFPSIPNLLSTGTLSIKKNISFTP